jgi:ABC-type transport system substrate-binding protein
MLTSFTFEQRAQLQAFSGYWGTPGNNYTSNVKNIIMIPYADPTTAQFALLQGQINQVQDETTNAESSLAKNSGFSTITSPTFEGFALYMHPVGPLADWRVRDAIKDAVNYTALVDSLTNGFGKPDSSFFYAGMQGYNSTIANTYATHSPNITGASALLKQAGYPNGFTVNLYTRPSSRYGVTFVDLAEILQSDLAKVNITLNIQVYVVGTFYSLAENKSLPGIWTVPNSLIVLSPNSNIVEWFGSGDGTFIGWSAATEKGPGVPFSQMITLANESAKATSLAQSDSYASQLDVLYNKYGPVLPLFQLSNNVASASSVKGVVWNSVQDQGIPYYLSIS